MESLRKELTPEQRATPLRYTIDPGFVNHRLCQTFLGSEGLRVVDAQIARLPQLPEWERDVRIDHIYTSVMLLALANLGVPTLEALLEREKGRIICSTETLAPCTDIHKVERAFSVWVPRRRGLPRVEFHYSTKLIRSDTLRSHLRNGETISVIARLRYVKDGTLIFDPFVMGNPWLAMQDEKPSFAFEWFADSYFENFVEDVDEFSRVQQTPVPRSPDPMRNISEATFKASIAEILGDAATGDWGGEGSDFFSAHLHLRGRPTTAAFVFKGPAKFRPMTLKHLGTNGDQLYRLSQEPAQLLVVQHCHDIRPAVRGTLRAFAVQPGNARRYMLIDGRDSLRLLRAYSLYKRTIGRSGGGRKRR